MIEIQYGSIENLRRRQYRLLQNRRLSESVIVSQVQPARRQHRIQTLAGSVLWCYCQAPDDGSLMVRCDKRLCATKWFHVRCLGETIDLNGRWECRKCRAN